MATRVARTEEYTEPTMLHWDEHYHYDQADLDVIRASGMFRNDQQGTDILFARGLDYVKAKVYNRKYPEISATILVPDDTSTPPYAEEVSVRIYDMVGSAKIVANYGDDLPRADIRFNTVKLPVRTIGDSFGYSLNEIRASRATGLGLDARKGEAARRAIEIKLANIRLLGDSVYGLQGLLNNSGLTEFVLPHTGPWSALTGDAIYINLTSLMDAYAAQANGVHRANRLVLAPPDYRAAATKFLGTGIAGTETISPTRTAMGMFREIWPEVEILQIHELINVPLPTPAHDMLLVYEYSAENLSHELVLPFSMEPPQARNLEFVTLCVARSGGTTIWFPDSILSARTRIY